MPFPFTFTLAAPGANPFLLTGSSPPSPHLGPAHRPPPRPLPIHPISANHIPPPLPSPLFDRSSNHFPSSIAPTNSLPRPTATPSSSSSTAAGISSRNTVPLPSKISRRPSPIPTIPTSFGNLAYSNTPVPAPLPLSKKRGWEPTFAEPSQSSATLASSNGYLDTPAKYREMMENAVEDVLSPDELPPPAKRRRGLAGSIVSTALSAALIGTAVGLTVYRLWRDRGKESDRLPPPPPYQQGEWVPDSNSSQQQQSSSAPPQGIQITPPTPSSKSTSNGSRRGKGHTISAYTSGGGNVRRVAQRRRGGSRAASAQPPGTQHGSGSGGHTGYVSHYGGGDMGQPGSTSNHHHNPPGAYIPNPQPEFDFGGGPSTSTSSAPPGGFHAGYNASGVDDDDDEMEVDDQMNWIGGKLSMLIEEGKKALGREVVVMSDVKEDEVDDGSGNWEEDDDGGGEEDRRSISGRSLRRGSIRKSRRGGTGGGGVGLSPPPAYSNSSSLQYQQQQQQQQYPGPTSPRKQQHFYSESISAPLPSTYRSSSPYGYASHSTSSTSVNTINGAGVSATLRQGQSGQHTRAGSLEAIRTEDESSWESRELQESMERARAAVIARKRGMVGMGV
ncbi:hypothetical protein BDN72DRAFT_878858 [Pluteus cervinus]|uniref:Uncharacterized protein n=1 Tax=Pluteus cervinus TaxID=181527 RepID=A0ACD3ATU8_9AGAR|nr:hypothetical protein BDN72DRAFT_878858 [Pluteus cervinus]